jgi:hypothetical protein
VRTAIKGLCVKHQLCDTPNWQVPSIRATPRYRNRYMINFIDHKSNYCRVFLARTKDAAAKLFEHFLVYFEKEFNC